MPIDINSSAQPGRKFPFLPSKSTRQFILALETSGRSGSCSILKTTEDSSAGTISSLTCHSDASSAKTLAPLIRQLMNQVSIEPAELSAIAVTTGPGSFTGLRVGVALSKAMSYALGIETIEVDTLHAMAYPFQLAENYHTFGNDEAINNKIKSLAFGDRVRLWTILDAYRGEFFVASWNIVKYQKHAELVRESETQIVDAETWCSLALNSLDEVNSHNEIDTATTEVIVTGAGVKKLRNSIDRVNQKVESVCGKPISVMEGVVPTSDSVARIGFEFLQQGQTVNPFELMPVYLRGSAAEEKKRK